MITQEELKSIIKYNPETGDMTWVSPRCRRLKPGDPVGYLDKSTGYIKVMIDKKNYYCHRLAFLYLTGEMPRYVDHSDGFRDNNKWDNLRACSQAQNNFNSKIRSDNTSGEKCVSFDKKSGKWEAYTSEKGNKRSLGRFASIAEATAVSQEFRRQYCGEFFRHA